MTTTASRHAGSEILALVGLLAVVLGVAAVAISLPQQADDPAAEPVRWVRTARGWEKAVWPKPVFAEDPTLHPGVLAALILGVSATSLALSRGFGGGPAGNECHSANSSYRAASYFSGQNRRLGERRSGDRRGTSVA